jgi:hypothetical protein
MMVPLAPLPVVANRMIKPKIRECGDGALWGRR